jgi:hypothetical protein
MNKRGNVFLNIGFSLFIFISGIIIFPYITDDITTTRADLHCEDFSGLTNGTILQCITISGIAPYFLWFLVSIVAGFLIGGLRD